MYSKYNSLIAIVVRVCSIEIVTCGFAVICFHGVSNSYLLQGRCMQPVNILSLRLTITKIFTYKLYDPIKDLTIDLMTFRLDQYNCPFFEVYHFYP